MLNFVFIQNAPLMLQKKLWVVSLCVLVQFALEAFMFWHFGGFTDDLLNAQFCIYSKRPPLASKKNGTKFCIYSKRPPPTSKKAVTTTKDPIKWPNSVFIQNAPILLSKNELTTRNGRMTKFCICSKRPPPTLYGAGCGGGVDNEESLSTPVSGLRGTLPP